jgi:NAD-dependent dihydropyrimidine dehydrogenase PreA subunit
MAWQPTINTGDCIGDKECVEFCEKQVFDWDEDNCVPIVARPQDCVDGCDACAQVCPVEAITFPEKA